MNDFSIFIDTPLDIAIARRLIRDGQSAETIVSGMENYLARGRKGYLSLLQTTKPNSDLIIDGNRPVQEIVTDITHHLNGLNRS